MNALRLLRPITYVVICILCLGLQSGPSVLIAEGQGQKHPRLVIDYGDGVEKHFTRLVWKKSMTALALTRAAQEHARGIKVVARGKGDRAFVTQIDGLANEGGGLKKRNWLFLINGKLGVRSCGVLEIQAQDVVTWKFGVYRDLSKIDEE